MKIQVDITKETLSETLQMQLTAETPEDRKRLAWIAGHMQRTKLPLQLDKVRSAIIGGGVIELILETAPEPDPAE